MNLKAKSSNNPYVSIAAGHFITAQGEVCRVGDIGVYDQLNERQLTALRLHWETSPNIRSYVVLLPGCAPSLVYANVGEAYLLEHEVTITYVNNPSKVYEVN
jgi:hypothetical protein